MAKMSRSAIAKKAWRTRKANAAMKGAQPKYETVTKLFGEGGKYSELNLTVGKAIPLYTQLDDALADLEARLCGTIRRIRSIGV